MLSKMEVGKGYGSLCVGERGITILNRIVSWSKCLCSPLNSCDEILNPKVMVLEGEAFRRRLDYESGALINSIRLLVQ